MLAVGLCVAWVSHAAAQTPFDEQSANGLVRYFTDSGHVSVRSLIGEYAVPFNGNAALSVHWNNEQVTIPAIKAPPGSQAAIDAITTASRPISGNAYSDFVKTRNEIQGELSKGPAAFEYYYSTEPDYLAQQVAARYNKDFAGQQFNLAVGSSYGWDAISPLADDDTNTKPSQRTTLHWDAVATRILTPTTLVRMGAETNIVDGLQHNPYRNVFAGGSIVPERHPDHRLRSDVFLKLNQYLQNRSSLKFSYRFYRDDWGVMSHELDSRLSQYITRGIYTEYEYRYYTQTSADFWRSEYTSINGVNGYQTGDYRLGPLASHLFGVTLNCDLGHMAPASQSLGRLGLRVSYDRYFNSNNYSANFLETGLDFRF